ncbi:GNAT family N-acetyltransferase [Gymnodinialimonas sp. 2305UL16-5]|uniref:GNAT family N-acetyltransferase n=1 Tax=Gymnodinialimonas mytili TaxID=3126503 RepID=UPI0030AFB397
MADQTDLHLRAGFPEDQRDKAAALYWEAFGGKLGKLLGPAPRALAFLAPVLNPDFALSVTDANGQLLGLAGFKTEDGALIGGDLQDLAQIHGWPGTLWRAPLLSLLERQVEPEILLMDGICVAPEARGRGLGSMLLEAICAEAARRDLRAVRLDVIDTNPRARQLYERKGFLAKGVERLGPLSWLFGFSSATRMERPV